MSSKPIYSFLFLLISFNSIITSTASAQPCTGHWVNNFPTTFQCISGQLIGTSPATPDPSGCPVNPVYVGRETNTFIFDNIVNNFVVDFNAFNSLTVGCARIQVKINNVFYPLTATNLIELPMGNTCSGSTSVLTITPDGYVTTNNSVTQFSNGAGRLVFTGVNATSVTLASNDAGGGSVFGSLVPLIVVPVKLNSFLGSSERDCTATLSWETGIESNVKNIEVQESVDGILFRSLTSVSPRGSDSRYSFKTTNYTDSYFRLKINDLDGIHEYSKILSVKSNCSNIAYQVRPNPASSSIEIIGLKNNNKVFILDMIGRTVLTSNSLPSNNRFDIEKLIPGIYNVQVINNRTVKANVRFLKR